MSDMPVKEVRFMSKTALVREVAKLKASLLESRYTNEAALNVLCKILGRWDDHETRLKKLEDAAAPKEQS